MNQGVGMPPTPAATSINKGRWFLRPPSPVAIARIFCIPYSGCGASMYRNWPDLRDSVEFCPLQLPGRESRFREPVIGSYEELGERLAEAVAPYLDVPYAFFGHCGSALAAYQVSAALGQSAYAGPTGLIVSSQVAPQDGPAGRFLALDDTGLEIELRKLVVEMGGVPTPDIIDMALVVLRADLEVNRRYVVPNPTRLTFPITAVGWSEDTEVPADGMAGWSVCGDTAFETLPGSHYRFIDAPEQLLTLMMATVTGGRVRCT